MLMRLLRNKKKNKGYTLKKMGKPTLFSFDFETEKEIILRKFKTDLNNEDIRLLFDMASSFLEIIKKRTYTIEDSKVFKNALLFGQTGVWEKSADYLEKLAFHFLEARNDIEELLDHSKASIREKIINSISPNQFDKTTEIDLCSKKMSDKSVKVRIKMANQILIKRLTNCLPLLETSLEIENNDNVKDAIKFAIKYTDRDTDEIIIKV